MQTATPVLVNGENDGHALLTTPISFGNNQEGGSESQRRPLAKGLAHSDVLALKKELVHLHIDLAKYSLSVVEDFREIFGKCSWSAFFRSGILVIQATFCRFIYSLGR